MLFAFFRSEVPHPWPNVPTPVRSAPAAVPAPAADESRRMWVASPSLTMAAAVALLLAGYTWLAGQFPQPQDPARPDQNPTGFVPGRSALPDRVEPLPNGGAARIHEERLPDGRIQINAVEVKPPTPPR
jgi:hypothetical protein